MSASLGVLVIVALVAGFAVLVVKGMAKAKETRADEALTVHAWARQRGWRVETPDSGDIRYRLHGQTAGGVAWTLAFDSDQSSSSSSPRLIWRAEGLKAARTELMIGSCRQWAGFSSGAAKLVFAGARRVLGSISTTVMDMSEFVEQATVSPYGSPAFREKFVIASRSPSIARALPERIEGLLLRWPAETGPKFDPARSVTVWLNASGLQVDCRIDGPAPPVADHVVAIGTALADALRNTSFQRP